MDTVFSTEFGTTTNRVIIVTEAWWSSQYKDAVLPAYDSHYKDKTVSRLSYLCHVNPHTWKDRL